MPGRASKGPYGLFQSVGSLNPGHSVFDLSYEKKLMCDMGQLIPIMCDEVVPGDVFNLGNEIVIRFQPLVSPILHEINCYVHYFFVPYRLLWSSWEDYITGGKDGTDVSVLPTWNPGNTAIGSLWDYLGFPVGVVPASFLPVAFPKYAYNLIYNEYYRDQTLITELDITVNETILKRAWEKDYFTSSLPWQQRGTAPALPISGSTTAVFAATGGLEGYLTYPAVNTGTAHTMVDNSSTHAPNDANTKAALEAGLPTISQANLLAALNGKNTVNLSSATTFNVADLRLAFQIQKWMERNARSGARYTEFLKAHYGVSPRDDRLQRPEYIGGSKDPVIISEVLKTATTDATSPQGNMAGHGIVANGQYVGKYHAKEFGLIMGIMSVMPRTVYSQGVDRQWIKKTKYDFYSPEFANLSEQPVYKGELYATAVANDNNAVFGYQGRYDEMRYRKSIVCGKFRTGQTFNFWHLGREFGALPALNQTFIECDPSKRIFAVQTEPGLIVNVLNRIRAARPMPISSEPGLIDHS